MTIRRTISCRAFAQEDHDVHLPQWLITSAHASPSEDRTRTVAREEVARTLLQKLDLATGRPIWEATLPQATSSHISYVHARTGVIDDIEDWRHPIVATYGGVTRIAIGSNRTAASSFFYQVVDGDDTHGPRVMTSALTGFPSGPQDKGLRVVGISPDGHWLCHSRRRVFLIDTDGAIVDSLDAAFPDATFDRIMRIIAFGPSGITAITGESNPQTPGDGVVGVQYTDWDLSGWTYHYTDELGGPWLLGNGSSTIDHAAPPWSLNLAGHDGYVVRGNDVELIRVVGGVGEATWLGSHQGEYGQRRETATHVIIRAGATLLYDAGVRVVASDFSSSTRYEYPVGFAHSGGFWWADNDSFYQAVLGDDEFEKRAIDGTPEWSVPFDADSEVSGFGKEDGVIVLSGSLGLPSLPGLCLGLLALDDDDGSVLWYAQKPITVAAMPTSGTTLSRIDEATGERYGSGARSKFGMGMTATVHNGAVYATSGLFFPPCLVD